MFYMRRLQDLSGLDSDLVLAEFCEQYPPLLNQIGMASRVKNYYKKVDISLRISAMILISIFQKPGKQDNPPMLDYGEIAYAHTSPFQADMLPGEILQVRRARIRFFTCRSFHRLLKIICFVHRYFLMNYTPRIFLFFERSRIITFEISEISSQLVKNVHYKKFPVRIPNVQIYLHEISFKRSSFVCSGKIEINREELKWKM